MCGKKFNDFGENISCFHQAKNWLWSFQIKISVHKLISLVSTIHFGFYYVWMRLQLHWMLFHCPLGTTKKKQYSLTITVQRLLEVWRKTSKQLTAVRSEQKVDGLMIQKASVVIAHNYQISVIWTALLLIGAL